MATIGTRTIFALSSGQPPAAIAVMRLSGPDALAAARALTTRDLPEARRAALRRFVDPQTSEVIDEGLLITFPGPRTETGEDMVELHCHGSHAVVRGIEAALARLPNLRLAEPGEFTRRAFLNGKMDLAAVEGLADLLAAETALQRRAAMMMMGGRLSHVIEGWTTRLRRLAAQVEAHLDFSDESDVTDAGALSGLAEACATIAREMDAELRKPSADRLKDGVRVVIAGPPNAGKSTLFNHLVGRQAAIVSPIAGTTRDVIEASVALHDIPMLISDCAGLRDAQEEIERIGVDRAEALLATADIILWLGSAADRPVTKGRLIQVHAKADLPGDRGGDGIPLSTFSGEGVERLVDELCEEAKVFLPVPGDYALSRRQQEVIARSMASVDEASTLEDEILIGECLRRALTTLDELTGRATTEAVLDELFSGFCIGK